MLQFGYFSPQRPSREPKFLCNLQKLFERCSSERHLKAPPERDEIGFEAVIASDHSEAGEATFAGFSLSDQGRSAPAAKVQLVENGQFRLETARNGSRIQSRKD